MTATATRSILDLPGGPPLEAADGFHPSQQAAVGALVTELRRVCGSLVPTGHNGAYAVTSRANWRTLRQCRGVELVQSVRRASRAYPDLRIPGTDVVSVHLRIEALLARGERDDDLPTRV